MHGASGSEPPCQRISLHHTTGEPPCLRSRHMQSSCVHRLAGKPKWRFCGGRFRGRRGRGRRHFRGLRLSCFGICLFLKSKALWVSLCVLQANLVEIYRRARVGARPEARTRECTQCLLKDWCSLYSETLAYIKKIEAPYFNGRDI